MKNIDYSIKDNIAQWYKNKVILITGATSGIGKAFALQLAMAGSKIIACGRDPQAMDHLKSELKETNCLVETILLDLSDPESPLKIAEKIEPVYSVDIIINNAGFGYMGNFSEMPPEQIKAMLAVNIYTMVFLCRIFLPCMQRKSGCGILNVASTASFFGTPVSSLYGATKHFVLGFTDALHKEVLKSGVHVSGLYPGHTYTRFAERASKGKTIQWKSAMTAEAVASAGLKGLYKNQLRVVPGLENKTRVWAAKILPPKFILAKIYRDASKKYGETYRCPTK